MRSQLRVPASRGLLANDRDPRGGRLGAVLKRTSFGSSKLTLNGATGAFTYRATERRPTVAWFSYSASDDYGVEHVTAKMQTVGEAAGAAPIELDLPVPGSPINAHNYHYPDLGGQSFDKAWQVSAPGRETLAAAATGPLASGAR